MSGRPGRVGCQRRLQPSIGIGHWRVYTIWIDPMKRSLPHRLAIGLKAIVALGFISSSAMAQLAPSPGETVRLQNTFTGIGKCLDIINDGSNNQLTMADCGNYTGQSWSVTKDGANYRLQTLFTGDSKCLDIVNDGQNSELTMAPCGNYSGQLWSFEKLGNYYRLRTLFTGPQRCLDVVNDGTNDRLTMAACADVSGQLWGLF